VEHVRIDGREYLLYKAPKPAVALIRATTADKIGNLSMEQGRSTARFCPLCKP